MYRTNLAVATGVLNARTFVHAVVAPATGNAEDVKEGSLVKAIFVEMWILSGGNTGTSSQFTLAIEKRPGNTPAMTAAQLVNLGAYNNKKNVLYMTQGVISGKDTNSIVVIRNWLKIPKGKQRFGLDDRIVVNFTPTGSTTQICGFVTFKEYT